MERKWYLIAVWNGVLLVFLIILFSNRKPALNEYQIFDTSIGTEDNHSPLESAVYFSRLDSLLKTLASVRPTVESEPDPIFKLKIPAPKGSIINIWRNDSPILSRLVQKSRDYQFDIPLEPGVNHIKYLIFGKDQRLILADARNVTYHNPKIEMLSRAIIRGNPRYRQLSLTFDGGAEEGYAQKILTILRQKSIHTTIFLTGKFIEKFPDLVKEMVADGHEIANHTYNHPHLTTYGRNKKQNTLPNVDRHFVQWELLKTDTLFFRLTGKHMAPYWRAPFGEYNRQILNWAAEIGYLHIRWTPGFDTFDWVEDKSSPLYKSPRQIYTAIVKKDAGKAGLNGAIVLMHLGVKRRINPPYAILPQLIDELRVRGYRIVPISNLLKP